MRGLIDMIIGTLSAYKKIMFYTGTARRMATGFINYKQILNTSWLFHIVIAVGVHE